MKIKIIGDGALNHEGKIYKAGSVVDLDDANAVRTCEMYPQWFELVPDKPATPKEVAK